MMGFLGKRLKEATGLNIIIVGCGVVGTALVEQLVLENHDITVVDTSPQKVQKITDMYDVMGVVGNGASFSVQKDAGIIDADLIIAVTDSDELNLLCCTVASRVGHCATIAKVRNPEYSHELNHIKDKLGLAMIVNPEYEASREIYKILCLPTALEVTSFAHGKADLVKIRIPHGNILDGMTLAQLGKSTNDVLICGVERDKQIYIPTGDFELKAGDMISFVAPAKKVSDFFKHIGFKTNKVKNTMIIGGGDAGYYLAKRLSDNGIDVCLIDKDKERCEEIATLLPKVVVINGNGVDEDLLTEEGIQSAESFVTLTGSDEENILLTVHAKQFSNAKLVTKINKIRFKDAINNLDIGSVIYPRYITSEAIIAYVRAKNASKGSNVETLYHLFDHRVEAVEFKIDKESKVTNTPIMKLKLKDNLLICFIFRRGKVIIPSGQDCILPGDSVMIVTTHTGFNDISNILA
ncbi:Trk system potassium transporter TrkA [uncultured Eubacterium sp.]|uniref:Trk system potassium transporter TrkA n=2 Tax=uncultured Eubacterium sp. TaxID=165185 RepID=UPI0025DE999F|nr:Trk system potassium transporter TrkA [uncultured Eubacterium sp.]